jgi:uncharacterized membrane protein YdjX (TVP38/TMEM64 family)
MARSNNEYRQLVSRIVAAIGVILVVLGVVALWRTGTLRELSNKEQIIQSLREDGIKGPLLCVATQFVQVVIFFIPGEITQFAAGYVFGVWRGLLYSSVGILLGSAFNFYFARFVGRLALEAIVNPSTVAKIDLQFAKAKTKTAIFVLFLLPGAPKDALCYAAGFSHMRLLEFLVISGLGRLPALFASLLFGSRLYHGDLISMTTIGLLAALSFLGYYLYERRRGGNI